MSAYLAQWMALTAVFALAVISPGPDFVMAVRNSLSFSRRAGVFTALGFAVGVLLHSSYTMLGLAVIISQSIFAFNALKWAGAAYLIYIGVNALRSKGPGNSALAAHDSEQGDNPQSMPDGKAFMSGFLTNVLNPKASLFFLAVFTQMVTPQTPAAWQAVYVLTCMAMTAAWFSFVAVALTHSSIKRSFMRAGKWIDRLCGAALIMLGIKVAITSR